MSTIFISKQHSMSKTEMKSVFPAMRDALLDDQPFFFGEDLHSNAFYRATRKEHRHPAREVFLFVFLSLIFVEMRFDWR